MIQWNTCKYLAQKKYLCMFDDDMPNPASQTTIQAEVHHTREGIYYLEAEALASNTTQFGEDSPFYLTHGTFSFPAPKSPKVSRAKSNLSSGTAPFESEL
ncbi:hypothetical protein BOTCAL_0225g00100 [Botryotinia calthae]|uniref:Uncharacterized protein n=1 Tax=Botryotinia calthae TaxID=38488 RepID=A0A4Y8CYQ3_9HELO|nr:hypothetical protein BOTCAL_0225g00100 [Botryotinia calthae]